MVREPTPGYRPYRTAKTGVERYFSYRVDSFEEGKRNTFHVTYLEHCIKYDGNKWISLPDDSLVLEGFPKLLILAGQCQDEGENGHHPRIPLPR